jgi:predicted alpha/beta-fold hydrolase
LPSLLGLAKITFTHSPSPLPLTKKDRTSTNLLSICQDSTPPCRLNPLLFNSHLQTIWTAINDNRRAIYYKRKVFQSDDPAYESSFAVDFIVPPFSENNESLPTRTIFFKDKEFGRIASLDKRPMLITLYGLSGGSHEIYLKDVLAPLVAAEGEKK